MRKFIHYLVRLLPVITGLLCLSTGVSSFRSEILQATRVNAPRIPNFDLLNAECIRIAGGHVSWKNIFYDVLNDSSTYDLVAQCHTLLTEALSQEPTDDVLWHNRAWCDRLLGDRRASLSDLHTAINLSPGDSIYRASEVLFALADQDEVAAETALSQSVVISPRILGSTFIQDLEVRHAVPLRAAVDQAWIVLSASSNDPISQAKLGRIALYRGHLTVADGFLHSSLDKLPNLGAAWRTVAIVQATNGELSESRTSAHKASLLLARPINVRDLIDHPYGGDVSVPSYHAGRFRVRYHQTPSRQSDILPKDLLTYMSARF